MILTFSAILLLKSSWFCITSPYDQLSPQKQIFNDNNYYHYYVKVLLISEIQYGVKFGDLVVAGLVIV